MTPLATTKRAKSESAWTATSRMPTFSSLDHDIHADVCIVGAGISGLTTAYMLMEQGKSVVVLDDGGIASGMTQVTTAHLSNLLDSRYTEIEQMHGEQGARLAAESHTAAIDAIEAIAAKEKIRCDFERLDGFLFLAPGQGEEILDAELMACHRAGLTLVEKLDCSPVEYLTGGPCLRFPNQAQFHPLKYLAGVAKAVSRDGGKIFTKTHVDRIEGGEQARVQAGEYSVVAGAVVVATNAPINDKVAIHTKQIPFMTYVIAARVPLNSVPKGLFWDTEEPFHYVRLQHIKKRGSENGAGYDLLIVGGEDHKTGHANDTADRHIRLENWARSRFPFIEEVEFKWAGQVMESIDGLAFIGRNPMDGDNVYVVTGDCGLGITHGTIAGILLTDLILGRDNPWARLYDPSRKPLRAAGKYVMHALDTAAQYADWVTAGDVESVAEIRPDEGAIVRRGMSKVAVYRDPQGELHECSAVCTHLGCIVGWNEAEKTWDCPCHGSRFNPFGKVINGPANQELKPISEK